MRTRVPESQVTRQNTVLTETRGYSGAMVSATLPAFLPFDLPSDFEVLVQLTERIENREESGERTYELYARCERVLGWFDVHGAQSADGVPPLLGYTLQPDVLALRGLNDEELLTLAAWLMGDGAAGCQYGEDEFARRVLATELKQGALTDLLYFPRDELTPARFLELAKNHHGDNLLPYLSEGCGPMSAPQHPDAVSLALARRFLAELARDGMIALSMGESTAHALALALPMVENLADWLVDAEGVAELFVGDEDVDAALKRVRES